MLDILETVDQWRGEGKSVAIATVAATWGSSPRRPGAKMGVSQDGQIIGSVSGGCVESAVVREALSSLEDGRPRLLDFGVSDDDAWSVGLSCGGRLKVFVEPLHEEWWRTVSESCRRDRSAGTALVLEGPQAGARCFASADEEKNWGVSAFDPEARASLAEAGRLAMQSRRSFSREIAGLNVLLDSHVPRPRLIVVGGAHVAMALQDFARRLGFRVILVDPRRAFATRERFPDADEIHHEYPQDVLPRLSLDRHSYVAVLTHDPKIDDPAMLEALPSPAPYVGVLSSLRTHEKRLSRLREAGLAEALLERIRVPIGLDIGASSPEEIALAIMAEIVAARNDSDRDAPG